MNFSDGSRLKNLYEHFMHGSYADKLKDFSDPLSIINRFPVEYRPYVLAVPDELLCLTEEELQKTIDPSDTLRKLRIAFWGNYDRICSDVTIGKEAPSTTSGEDHKGSKHIAKAKSKSFYFAEICWGICSPTAFEKIVVHNPAAFAFILTPPPNYDKTMEGLLEKGMARLTEIMDIPIYQTDKNGKRLPDVKAAALVLAAIKMVDDRVKGGAIQRLESKQLTVNANMSMAKYADEKNADALLARIKELEMLTENPTASGRETLQISRRNRGEVEVMDE